jgi:hypothetical protein
LGNASVILITHADDDDDYAIVDEISNINTNDVDDTMAARDDVLVDGCHKEVKYGQVRKAPRLA